MAIQMLNAKRFLLFGRHYGVLAGLFRWTMIWLELIGFAATTAARLSPSLSLSLSLCLMVPF